jgi:hypothetical protein
MERYIHEQNLGHYRRLLAEPDVANNQARHEILIRLLSDEMAKRMPDMKVRIDDHNRWIDAPRMRWNIRPLVRNHLGILDCGMTARSQRPAPARRLREHIVPCLRPRIATSRADGWFERRF